MGKVILNEKRFQDLMELEILSVFSEEIKFPLSTFLPESFAQGKKYRLDYMKLSGIRELTIVPVAHSTWSVGRNYQPNYDPLVFKLTKKQYDYLKYLCL